MASIFTGLAFMHGHIVNKELVLALGARENDVAKAKRKPGGNALTAGALAQDLRSQDQPRGEPGECGAAACC